MLSRRHPVCTDEHRQLNRSGSAGSKERYGFLLIAILCLLLGGIPAVMVLIQRTLYSTPVDTNRYQRHYIYVGSGEVSFISNRIFESARRYGAEKGIYVERLQGFQGSNYGDADYLKMAISMKADGIILEGSRDDEERHWLNRAAEQGIPVIMVLSDCPGSRRAGLIELPAYQLGCEYAKEVKGNVGNGKVSVQLLMDDSKKSEELYRGMIETFRLEGDDLEILGNGQEFEKTDPKQKTILEEGLYVQLGVRSLLTSDPVSPARQIKDILTGGGQPDILICMDAYDTQLVYQTVMDYGLETEVSIIGSCVSEPLIQAVQSGELTALIDVDCDQAGIRCVDALEAYLDKGSVSRYGILEHMVIDRENAARYLENE